MQTAGFSQNVLLNNEYPFCKMSYDVEQVITFQHVINMKRKPEAMMATLKDVAKETGLTVSTVSPGIE